MENLNEIIVRQDVVDLQNNSKGVITRAMSMTVASSDEMDVASTALSEIAQSNKKAEMMRKFFVEPFNSKVKDINAFFKDMKAPADEAEAHLRKQIGSFTLAERKREEEEQAEADRIEREKRAERDRIQAEADAKKEEEGGEEETAGESEPTPEPTPEPEPVVAPTVVPSAKVSSGRVATKMVWKHRVIDISKMPSEYLLPNSAELTKAVRGGVREIEGVEIYQDAEVMVK